jgi:hypothetical protein
MLSRLAPYNANWPNLRGAPSSARRGRSTTPSQIRRDRRAKAPDDGRRHGARVELAKSEGSPSSAPAIAVSHANNRSSSWAIVDARFGRISVIYFALLRSEPRRRAAAFAIDHGRGSVYRTLSQRTASALVGLIQEKVAAARGRFGAPSICKEGTWLCAQPLSCHWQGSLPLSPLRRSKLTIS